MSNSPLFVKSFVFGSPAGLKLTAKRYTHALCVDEGITLIFAHCVGSHKEQWEPTIEQIIRLQQSKDGCHRIREAWAFDWQNHGDAAVLNEHLLKSRPDGISPTEWALSIATFVKSPYMHGHRIVAIGHSAGTAAILFAMKEFSVHHPPYTSVFLVEPTIISKELFSTHSEERQTAAEMSMKATLTRRDSWASKEDASHWLRKRMPWKSWDRRVFDLYLEHGLRTLPLAETNLNSTAVVLKCDKQQEGVAYPNTRPYIEATTLFMKFCTVLPIHIIFGAKNDFVPLYMKESLSQGKFPASVVRIPGVGHMIVQEQPDALAEVICNKLNSTNRYASLPRL